MDLLDQLREMRDVHASTLPPGGEHDDDRYGALIDKAVTLIIETPDVELVRAYRCVNGEQGNPEADALLAEIERRGLDL